MIIEVDYDYLPTVVYEKLNFHLSKSTAIIGRATLSDGSHQVRIGAKIGTCQLRIKKTDSHLPIALSHIIWRGREYSRGRRT